MSTSSMVVVRNTPWASQPQVPVGIDWDNCYSIGLRRAIIFTPYASNDIVNKSPITYYSKTFNQGPLGIGLSSSTSTQQGCAVGSWINTTSEASVIFIQQRYNTTNSWWCELGDSGLSDHFGYTNLAYSDAFWNSLWMNGVSFPANKDIRRPHIVILTVKNGEQKAYYDGILWHTNNLSSGFTLPSTLQFGSSEVTVRTGFDGLTYAIMCFDKVISASDAIALSSNPWQIFQPQRSYDFSKFSGGQGVTTRKSWFLGSSSKPPVVESPPVIHDKPWTSQPQLVVRLAPSKAKTTVIDCGNQVVVNTGKMKTSGTLTSGVGSIGRSLYKAATSNNTTLFPIPTITIGTGDFTLAVCFEFLASEAANSYVYLVGQDTFAYFTLAAKISSISGRVGMVMPGAVTVDSGITGCTSAGLHKIVVRRIGGQMYFAVDSSRSSAVANSTSISSFSNYTVGSYWSGASSGPTNGCHYYSVALEARGWSDAEANAFMNNPWQIFQPLRSSKVYISAPKTDDSYIDVDRYKSSKYETASVPWTSQPPAGTPINFSTGVWSSVLLPSSSGGFVDCVSPSRQLTYNSITNTVRSPGVVVSNVSTGTGYVLAPGACQGQKMSRLAVVYVNVLATSNVISESKSTNVAGGAQWGITSAGELYLVKTYIVGVGLSSGAGITSGKWYTVGMTYDGLEVCLFVNGKYVGGGNSAQTFSIDASASLFRSAYTGSADNLNGELSLHADCQYALPRAAMEKLTKNPWQIFQPQKRKLYVDNTPKKLYAPALVTIRKTWTNQPPAGTPMDTLHKDQTAAIIGGIVSGVSSISVSSVGRHFTLNGSSDYRYVNTNAGDASNGTTMLVVVRFRSNIVYVNKQVIGRVNTLGESLLGFTRDHGNSSFVNAWQIHNGVTWKPISYGIGALTTDVWYVLSACHSPNTGLRIYKNGTFVAEDASATGFITGVTSKMFLGCGSTDGSTAASFCDCDIAFGLEIPISTSDAWHAKYGNNPWQIFQPTYLRTYKEAV